MLDFYQAPHLQAAPPALGMHVSDSHHGHSYSHPHHFPSPPASYHHSPHEVNHPQLHDEHARHSRHRTNSPTPMGHPYASSSQQSRKRRRTSRSPVPPRARASSSAHSQDGVHPHELPLSPYSSASSAQSGGSPSSRESMAINSLLLTSHSRDEDMPKRHTSAERSTSMGSRER